VGTEFTDHEVPVIITFIAQARRGWADETKTAEDRSAPKCAARNSSFPNPFCRVNNIALVQQRWQERGQISVRGRLYGNDDEIAGPSPPSSDNVRHMNVFSLTPKAQAGFLNRARITTH
jgi:hypothetical protein